ncbi:hypothetical protein [Arcobacter sp. L]|nr:hypothetical protein [Arcobacter sp. L]
MKKKELAKKTIKHIIAKTKNGLIITSERPDISYIVYDFLKRKK